jgi:large subunit ribosomal protein L19e
MNLKKKKNLAQKTLNVGKGRIVFVKPRLGEIKEAITKQDIRDLVASGAIVIKENKGRKRVNKKRKKIGAGKVRKRLNTRKTDYMLLTRKLREYIYELRKLGKISRSEEREIRKKIINRVFKSKAHLKEQIKPLK